MNEHVAEPSIQPVAPPLRIEAGAVRVGRSRVSLDLIVEQYSNGMTPEGLVRAYDTLELADVHASIAYYHREQVEEYMRLRPEEADSLKAGIEAEQRLSKQVLLSES